MYVFRNRFIVGELLKIGFIFLCLHKINFSHDGAIIGQIFGSVVGDVSIGAVLWFVLATLHQIEETNNWSINKLVMGVSAVFIRKLTLA